MRSSTFTDPDRWARHAARHDVDAAPVPYARALRLGRSVPVRLLLSVMVALLLLELLVGAATLLRVKAALEDHRSTVETITG